jgi:hypothetical protein
VVHARVRGSHPWRSRSLSATTRVLMRHISRRAESIASWRDRAVALVYPARLPVAQVPPRRWFCLCRSGFSRQISHQSGRRPRRRRLVSQPPHWVRCAGDDRPRSTGGGSTTVALTRSVAAVPCRAWLRDGSSLAEGSPGCAGQRPSWVDCGGGASSSSIHTTPHATQRVLLPPGKTSSVWAAPLPKCDQSPARPEGSAAAPAGHAQR